MYDNFQILRNFMDVNKIKNYRIDSNKGINFLPEECLSKIKKNEF